MLVTSIFSFSSAVQWENEYGQHHHSVVSKLGYQNVYSAFTNHSEEHSLQDLGTLEVTQLLIG